MKSSGIISLIFAICIFFIIILGPLSSIFTDKSFYNSEFSKIGVTEKLGKDKIQNITLGIIEFIDGKESENFSEKLSEAELSHMKDVRRLVHISKVIYWISAGTFIVLFIFLYRKNKNELMKELSLAAIYGGLACLLLILSFGIAAFFNFYGFFNIFHQAFFPQGNWMFEPSSFLIQLFPEQFFIDAGLKIGVGVVLQAILIIILGYYIHKYTHRTIHRQSSHKP